MIELGQAIMALTASIRLVKEIKDTNQAYSQAELKSKMAEIYSALADAKMALADAKGELAAKDSEIAKLQAAFEFRGQTVRDEGYTYQARADGTPQGAPFCPYCEQSGKYFRIEEKKIKDGLTHYCPHCSNTYHHMKIYLYED